MRSMDPDPVLLCRRAPCRGDTTYRDQETHDFLHHGGYPPPSGMDPLDVTTHADYASDPVRRASAPAPYGHEAEEEAWASARAIAIVIVVLLVTVFVVTIVLVSGRPAPS